MPLESARTGERVLMPCRLVCRATLWTLFTGPRFRPDFHRNTVFLRGTDQSLGEFFERPDVVGLDGFLIDQWVSSTSVKPPIYTVSTPSAYSRSSRSRHSASWAWSRRRARFRHSRRIRSLLYRPSGSLDCNRAISCAVSRNRWNNSALVRVLLAGRRGTSDEILRTNVQSGHQTTSDGQSEITEF